VIDGLYGGCIPLDVLFLSQQLTNLAAVFAHSCPADMDVFGCFHNYFGCFEICGKYVSLMSWQVVRKCSSVCTSCWVQWVQSLSSLGSQVCRWRPLSTARLCSLCLYLVKDFLSLGSVTMLRYSAIVYCLLRAK